jgi:predicted DNA-binding antitoxin AbrB/MazE fold protein
MKENVCMNEWVEAIFENGAFHPQSPVNVGEGERVSLHVQPATVNADDLADIRDLLDHEYLAFCQQTSDDAPSLEEVRTILSTFRGSLADRIIEERDER